MYRYEGHMMVVSFKIYTSIFQQVPIQLRLPEPRVGLLQLRGEHPRGHPARGRAVGGRRADVGAGRRAGPAVRRRLHDGRPGREVRPHQPGPGARRRPRRPQRRTHAALREQQRPPASSAVWQADGFLR